jgi:hypothetical protein
MSRASRDANCGARLRGCPVVASGRERGDTGRQILSAAYSMARRRFWKRARRQRASSRPRCSLPPRRRHGPHRPPRSHAVVPASPPAVPQRRALGIILRPAHRRAQHRLLPPRCRPALLRSCSCSSTRRGVSACCAPPAEGAEEARARSSTSRQPSVGDADAPESGCRGKMPTRLAPAGVDGPCSST